MLSYAVKLCLTYKGSLPCARYSWTRSCPASRSMGEILLSAKSWMARPCLCWLVAMSPAASPVSVQGLPKGTRNS